VCQTLSKAWAISRNAAVQNCFSFLQAYSNFVDYSVCLLNYGMMLSESKLIELQDLIPDYVISKSIQRKFFEVL
jgi:hypothetical protein